LLETGVKAMAAQTLTVTVPMSFFMPAFLR
jgi:hypothetical protein